MFFISHVSGLVENFNIGIYSETINVINVKLCIMILVKLCIMILLSELYLFIPLLVTLTIFQCHSSFEQFKRKILCSYPVKLKLCRAVK